jgi:hypothetical protein
MLDGELKMLQVIMVGGLYVVIIGINFHFIGINCNCKLFST